MARTPESAESLAAFATLLDDISLAAPVRRGVWFGTPAATVEGKVFLCLWRGALVARLGAEEVDLRVLSGDGVRFDPSGKGRAMRDWLESTAEPADWEELALTAIAFTCP